MKTRVEVEYIESGAFQGGEEDASRAGIEYGEMCYVVRKPYLAKLRNALTLIRAEGSKANPSINAIMQMATDALNAK
jgi:hypothetical protein